MFHDEVSAKSRERELRQDRVQYIDQPWRKVISWFQTAMLREKRVPCGYIKRNKMRFV